MKPFQHINWDSLPVENVNPLFDRQFIVGSNVMVARILMKKGCVVPEHSHHNEQITQVISGAMEFNIDGKTLVLRPGEFLFIPPNMPHSAQALEDAVSFDTFNPPRQDWIDKTDAYLRK